MRNFYSIFTNTKSNELVKPNGQIPYTLYNKFKYNSTIVTYDYGEKYNMQEINGVKIEFLKKIFGKPIIDGSLFIMKNAKKIDILHTFHWKKENYLWFTLYKLLNPKGKIYLTLDSDERVKNQPVKKGVTSIFRTAILKKCDLVSVETKDMCEWFQKNWYSGIKYVPYGVLTSDYEIEYNNKENTIITVGRIGTHQKATEILMDAYKKIYKEIPNWNVRVIGPIEAEFIKEIDKFYKEDSNLKDKIQFIGPIYDREKLMLEFEKAKIFCLTSRYESFGLVLSEAGSRGNYIISTNLAPSRDLTDGEQYGTLFEIDNANELAEKLRTICLHEETLRDNCKNIQNFINKNFSWEAVCKKALEYLGEEIKYED